MPRFVNDNGSVNASLSGRPNNLLLAVNKLLFGVVNRTHVTLAHGLCCELPFAPLPFTSTVQLHIRSLALFETIGAPAWWLADCAPCVFLSRVLSFLSRALSRRWLLLVRLLALDTVVVGVTIGLDVICCCCGGCDVEFVCDCCGKAEEKNVKKRQTIFACVSTYRGHCTTAASVAAAAQRLYSRYGRRLCDRFFVAVAAARARTVAVIGAGQRAILLLLGFDDFMFGFGCLCARFGAFDFHFESFVQCGLVIDGQFIAGLTGSLSTGIRRHRATCGGVARW